MKQHQTASKAVAFGSQLLFFAALSMIMLLLTIVPINSYGDQNSLTYLIFSAPPYMVDSHGVRGGSTAIGGVDSRSGVTDPSAIDGVTGIDVEIIRAIAQRMELNLKIQSCPWKRCLSLMEFGEADILSSVFKRPEREIYLYFFDTPYLTHLPIAFYTLRDKRHKIEKYEDIYNLHSVGVLRGASYFDQFDKDDKVNKYEVNSQPQLIPMLLEERFDGFAGYVDTVNYSIVVEGLGHKIEKSIYQHNEISNVYMAISKKSSLASRLAQFNAVNDSMVKDGTIGKIIDYFYKKYRVD